MNFTQLKYALEIEKTRSITKAAQNLYMSQPNLSKAVKELEGEIGTKIFLRSAKGVEITKNGVEFLAYARTIVAQMEALEAIYKPHTSETLSLNFCMPRATYISIAFTDFLNQIGPENHISINLRERNSQDTINYVADGEADFGVIRVQEAYESYFFYTLKEKGLDYRSCWSTTRLFCSRKTARSQLIAAFITVCSKAIRKYCMATSRFIQHTRPSMQKKPKYPTGVFMFMNAGASLIFCKT